MITVASEIVLFQALVKCCSSVANCYQKMPGDYQLPIVQFFYALYISEIAKIFS